MPLLSPLLVDAFIKDALSYGVGVTEALSVFRAAGGAIRTQTFLDRFRQIGSLPTYGSQLARLTGTSPVPQAMMTTREVQSGKAFVYHFEITLAGDAVQGENPFMVTFASNKNLSVNYLRQRAKQMAQERVAPSDITVQSVALVEVVQQITSAE